MTLSPPVDPRLLDVRCHHRCPVCRADLQLIVVPDLTRNEVSYHEVCGHCPYARLVQETPADTWRR